MSILRSGLLGGRSIESRDSTNLTNELVGIPPGSTFLYAGRAFPQMDYQVYILFSGALTREHGNGILFEENMKGGARPFDKGGLFDGRLDLRVLTNRNEPNNDDYIRYYNEHNLNDLSKWRDYYALFLKGFFDSPGGYWDSCPNREIDGAIFHERDKHKWRNWTFEVHIEPEVELQHAGTIIMSEDVHSSLEFKIGYGDQDRLKSMAGKLCQKSDKPREYAEDIARRVSVC